MTHAEDSWAFREEVRRDLRTALKSRKKETVSVLRTMITAIDNAEAVRPEQQTPRSADGAVAYSLPGVGSSEVPRRELTMPDVHAIVADLLREYEKQERQYRSMHQHEAADSLRRQASVLGSYLDTLGHST